MGVQKEQDDAAGGGDYRQLQVEDGSVAIASVAVRKYARTPTRQYGYLQFKAFGKTVTKYIGIVTADSKKESLEIGWRLLRQRQIVETCGWKWVKKPRKTKPIGRGENMRRIRSKDTQPELVVRRLAHALGFRFRLHRKDLPGRPDLAFIHRRKVIFVHGCFWHQHPSKGCSDARMPKSRTDYWHPKLERNVQRDKEHIAALQAAGWDVLVVWECETKAPETLAGLLKNFLT